MKYYIKNIFYFFIFNTLHLFCPSFLGRKFNIDYFNYYIFDNISWVLVLLSFCRKKYQSFSYPKFVNIFSLGFVLCFHVPFPLRLFFLWKHVSVKLCILHSKPLALLFLFTEDCSLYLYLLFVKRSFCSSCENVKIFCFI